MFVDAIFSLMMWQLSIHLFAYLLQQSKGPLGVGWRSLL